VLLEAVFRLFQLALESYVLLFLAPSVVLVLLDLRCHCPLEIADALLRLVMVLLFDLQLSLRILELIGQGHHFVLDLLVALESYL
jgi:hypothetical protein